MHEGAAVAQRGLVGEGDQIFIEIINPAWLKELASQEISSHLLPERWRSARG